MNDYINKIVTFIKENKKVPVILIVGIIGLVLIITGKAAEKKDNVKADIQTPEELTEMTEKKLESLCLEIDGINDIHIMVTLDSTEENVYAENISINSQDTEYNLFEDSDGGGLLRYTVFPKVRGVAVVCTDGNNPKIKSDIINTVSAALGISSAKISVADNGKR